VNRSFSKTDGLLWAVILAYTAVIYATLSCVGAIRKELVERFGPQSLDILYVVFIAAGVIFLCVCLRRFRGARLVKSLIALCVAGCMYAYYLTSIKYAIERIHFLEYGVLGALVCATLGRRMARLGAAISAVNIVYWIGLGDETIQHLLPDRVGEIRDCITNLVSGALGAALVFIPADMARDPDAQAVVQRPRLIIVFLMVSTLITALFLARVHGFGYVYERKETGTFFSSLPPSAFKAMETDPVGVSDRVRAVYEDEAARHLFQREFYFINDYQITGGGFYRKYDHAYYENQILEKYFPRFLKYHALESARFHMARYDASTAQKALLHTVKLPDSTVAWLSSQLPRYNNLFTSRVKGTIITSFGPGDLFFYIILLLSLLTYALFRCQGRLKHHL